MMVLGWHFDLFDPGLVGRDRSDRPDSGRGRGGFRRGRGRGAGRGGFGGDRERFGKRDYERHSGSDKT